MTDEAVVNEAVSEVLVTETVQTDKLHAFETDLYCDLTGDEVRERGESLATTLEQIRQEKEEMKDFAKAKKQIITGLEERCRKLGDATRFHRELRLVSVDVVHAGAGMVNEVRTDTGEIIRNRRMSEVEAQMTVPSIAPGAEKRGKGKKAK
jgi:hypothetical protein